jgi:hypothetical protein
VDLNFISLHLKLLFIIEKIILSNKEDMKEDNKIKFNASKEYIIYSSSDFLEICLL